MITLKEKVKHCLEKYPETRNSDILLTRAVWHEYHYSKGFMNNGELAYYAEDLMELPREDNVKRYRAKFNEDGFYRPSSEEVLKNRGLLNKVWKEEFSPSNPSKY